jgi:hypothetical protein
MKKNWLIIWLLCFSLPAFAGGLHFGIIDAVKEQKEKLKEKIRKGEEYKAWQEERRKELIYAGVGDESVPKIHVFNNLGEYVMGFGSQGTGDGEFGTPTGEWWKWFNLPDIGVDGEKNLWAIDFINSRIQKFTKEGNFLLKFGKFGTGTGEFTYPSRLFIDKENNIYVLDYGLFPSPCQRIQKFDKYGNFLMKIDELKIGNWKYRMREFLVTIDQEDNLYGIGEFEDSSYLNYFIYRFDQNGSVTARFGNGEGTGIGQFGGPNVDIEIDKENNIFVLDYSLCRVQKFDKEGNFLLKFGSKGIRDDEFQKPFNMVIDTKGNLYITDNNCIKIFNNEGKFLRKFGEGEYMSAGVNF